MTTTELSTRLERCRQQRWRFGSGDATAVSFQAILENELAFLNALKSAEANWREQIRSGELHYSPAFANILTGYYREWEASARQRLDQLDRLEERGCHVPASESFRLAVEDVQSTLEECSWVQLGRRARANFIDED